MNCFEVLLLGATGTSAFSFNFSKNSFVLKES